MMHRAYDRVKTAFRRLPSTYDLVTTRLSESEAASSKRTKPITSGGNMRGDGLSFRFHFCFRL